MQEPPFEIYRKMWAKLLVYSGISSDGRNFSRLMLGTSVAMGALFGMLFHDNPPVAFVVFVFIFGIEHIGAYAYFTITASNRAGKVEDVLPDYLELMSSNIRSGLTPDKALLVSARPEFGALSEAVYRAGTKSITGMPLDQVMSSIPETIRSDVLAKTITLIVEGLHSGGDLPELLSKTALDLRKFRSVRSEINSIIMSYVLFIMAAIAIGAPMLYGIASFLVEVMVKIRSKVNLSAEAMSKMQSTMSIFNGKLLLTPEGVTIFALASIVMTIFFGCIAIGSMSSGRKVEGLKYFPVITLVGIGVFFIVHFGLQVVFGSFTKF